MPLLPHRPRTDAVVESSTRWATQTADVAALVLYGSVHRRSVHEHSDVDLIMVCQPGTRDRVWSERHKLAEEILGSAVAWSHELPWQGPYRYQAWTATLTGIDLTLDEGDLDAHEVLADGYTLLYGTVEPPNITPPAIETLDDELDAETWAWFLGLHGWLLQGRHWQVYHDLVQLIDTRIRPQLPPDNTIVGSLLPTGLDHMALLRALQTTMTTWDNIRTEHGLTHTTEFADAIRGTITETATGR